MIHQRIWFIDERKVYHRGRVGWGTGKRDKGFLAGMFLGKRAWC